MKKKILLIIGILIVVSACTLGNTPKSKVTELLKKYNNHSEGIKMELGDYLNALDLDEHSLEGYREVYLRQYSDLEYEITDESIDGDTAVVTAKIKVYDYHSGESDINDYIGSNQEEFFGDEDEYDPDKALKYRIEELGKITNKITYTIDFTLTKVNKVWTVDTLTNEQLEKIHGTYAH